VVSLTTLDADFDAIATDWPATVTIGGAAVTAVVSAVRREDEILPDGVLATWDFEADIKASDIASIPAHGTVVAVTDALLGLTAKKLYIAGHTVDGGQVTLRLRRV
jgi:hypothetical protein